MFFHGGIVSLKFPKSIPNVVSIMRELPFWLSKHILTYLKEDNILLFLAFRPSNLRSNNAPCHFGQIHHLY